MQNVENNASEIEELELQYARKILSIDAEIKNLQQDKKLVRDEAKDDGVDVVMMNKAIAETKKIAKMGNTKKEYLDELREKLLEDPTIKLKIEELIIT